MTDETPARSAEPRTVVHFVRHGEVFNPSKVIYGRLPGYSLSELGNRQAKTVAEILGDRPISSIFSSPLERAIETATPLADLLNLPIVKNEDLVEWEGRFDGIAAGDPRLKPSVGLLLKTWNPVTPSWGESYKSMVRRMSAALDSARRRSAGTEGVCFSHELPICTLRRSLRSESLWRRQHERDVAHTSITSVTFSGEALVDVSYSASHVPTD